MGHAHHFLERLDRLSIQHCDLALALYREHERLRYVLQEARVPEGAERVALSLDDPQKGPFVIVTRAGRFVTCLGRGMRAFDLPVITRQSLDALSAKHGLWRERDAAIEQLGGIEGGAAFVLGRLLDAGPYLAREEFQALAALQPLIGDVYLSTATEWTLSSRHLQAKLRHALKKRGPRLRPDQLELLEMYWKTFFAAGHLVVLSAIDEGETIRQVGAGDEKVFVAQANVLTAVVVDGGILSRTVRGAWALGQIGETWIPHAERWLSRATSAYDIVGPAIALLAIGARRPDLRPEVARVFQATPEPRSEDALTWFRFLSETGVKFLDDVDRMLEEHLKLGAAVAFAFRDAYPENSPYHYAREEDVPADIAFSEPFQIVSEYAREPGMVPRTIAMIIPAARAPAEQLYLPRRCVEFLEPKWAPEHSLALMEGWLEAPPVPRPTGPTRSGPCPCGSGKKYKRCCAPAETA